MRGERWRTDRDVLRDCWGRWTAILSLFARRSPARRRLDPRAYADLRKQLLAVCRSLAAADGPERSFHAGLEETVKPWLDLGAFNRADSEILSGLLEQCRKVDAELNGRRWRPALSHRGELALWIVSGGAVAGGLVWMLTMIGIPVLATLWGAVDMVWIWFRYADHWQKASIFAVMVVVASMYIVSRSARA